MENLNKYQNGKIYKITDNAYTECYIGSTTQPLCNRMAEHRKSYKAFKNGTYHFVSLYDLFDKFGVENCKIELVAETPCETKEQLRKTEGEYIRDEDCINKRIEGRTHHEWCEENKHKISENKKEYYKNNIDIIKTKKGTARNKQGEGKCKE